MLPDVELAALPRMADFAQWGEAVIHSQGGRPGFFLERYNDNHRAACEAALDDCPIAEALRRLVESLEMPCHTTATTLFRALTDDTPQNVVRTAQWPKNPRSFCCALRRIALQLHVIGIGVRFDRIDNIRTIAISQT